MKLAREETKIKVTGRSFYRKNNLKFEGRNRNRSRNRNRNRGQKIWDPEPEPEPRQNGMVPQHWSPQCPLVSMTRKSQRADCFRFRYGIVSQLYCKIMSWGSSLIIQFFQSQIFSIIPGYSCLKFVNEGNRISYLPTN
jgi:hypothetical protein